MKFAIIVDGEVESIHEGHSEAVAAMSEPRRKIMPIMTVTEYNKHPNDYKGCMYGRPVVMYLEEPGGTVSGPVYLIEEWTSYQLSTVAERYERYINMIWKPKVVKRYDDWEGDLSLFLKVGDLVDEGFVDHFTNNLPPATHKANLIQLGEPFNQVDGKATYPTLSYTGDGWAYMGNCFRGSTEARGGL